MPQGLVARAVITFLKVWACLLLLAAVSAPIAFYFASLPPKIGEHVTPANCPISVPDSASDICYFVPPAFGHSAAYEFNVPEADFRKWAESRGIDVEPIGPSHVTVRRYLSLMPHVPLGGPDDPPVGFLRVNDGLAYFWEHEDQGRAYVYDRSTGRAYVFTHTR